MDTNIQIFNHEQFGQIRICQTDGKEWFCLSDVCKALEINNPRQLKTRLQQRGVITNDTPTYNQHGTMVMQKMTYIDEANLYRCIFQSRKQEAEQFQSWVFEVVLPQIRKTGGYGRGGGMTDMSAQSMMTMLMKPESIKMLCKTVVELDEKVQELQPKAEYTEQVLLSPTCYTMTQVAKGLSMTVGVLQLKLMQKGIIYRSPSGPFMLYAKYLDRGLEAYRTKTGQDMFGNVEWTNTYLVWTEKGRKFINELLSPPTPKGGVL